MKKIMMIALLITTGYISAFAQQPKVVVSDKAGWHKIGESTVDYSSDRDEIMVMGANRFSKLKLKITDAPVHITTYEIYFESGDMQTVSIDKELKAPVETEVVELKGGERDVKKVVFVYKTPPNVQDKKAKVELWGLKTNADK